LDDSGYKIEVLKISGEYFVRGRIRSRHSFSAKYNVYIRYNSQSHLDFQWLCRCKNGLRTVDCCSHIASIIYYLGYARHHEDPHTAVHLADIFPDAPPMVVDSDEEE
jgi:hypothetical protein